MSDLRIRDFATRAQAAVELPDFEDIAGRGRRLRRRRTAMVAGAAAIAVGLAGYVVTTRTDPLAGQPADRRDEVGEARVYGGGSGLPLDAGTYELMVGGADPTTVALVTVPDGWLGGPGGPARLVDGVPAATVVVLDVSDVVTRPCRPQWFGMEEIGDDPASLVEALQAVPRHPVVQPPTPDDRFGHPATHLRLRGLPSAVCRGGRPFWVVRSDRGLFEGGPGWFDIWVVDVEGRTVTVVGFQGPGAPASVRNELEDVLASVRLEAGED